MSEIIGNNVEAFRLVDVDGVILANPNDWISIPTPEKFSDTTINLDRTKNNGFDYEFSDPNTKYIIDNIKPVGETISGRDLLVGLINTVGIDFNCLIEYRITGALKYQGKLMGSSADILDIGVEVNSVRVNFDDLFRTRKKVKVAMNATTSIDGSSVTGITPTETFLHSKAIVEKGNSDFDKIGDNDTGTAVTDPLEDFVVFNTFNNVIEDSFDEIRNYEGNVAKTKQQALDDGSYRLKNYKKRETLLNKINLELNVDYSVEASGFADVDGGTVTTYVIIADELGVIKSEFIADTTTIPSGANSVSFTVSITYEKLNIILSDNDEVYCYSIISADTTDPSITYSYTQNSGLLNCEFEVTVANSRVNMYNVFDVFNHILEVINNKTNIFSSSFFDTGGGGEKNKIANGYMLRGKSETDRPPETSFNEMLDYAVALFGLGYAIVEVSGVTKLLMERYSHFYQNKLITTIDSVKEGSMIIKPDTSLMYNEIDIGYKKFPTGTDKNDSNSIDEFLTEQENLTPIKTHDKKLTLKSPVIHSGYLIEDIRKQSFEPEKRASNDDKLFGVSVTDGTSNIKARGILEPLIQSNSTDNTLKVYSTYMDVKDGDTITITNAGVFNGVYVINTVDDGFITVLNCVSVTHDNNAVGGSFDFTLSSPRYRAERNDPFDVLDGVFSPETVYNARHNIKNMLFNHAPIINSGFNFKPSTSIIKTTQAKINGLMRSQLKVGELDSTLDPDRQTIIQNQDLQLSNINQNQKLFTGYLLIFECYMTQEIMNRIIDACTNKAVDDINFGYLSVKYIDGNYINGFVMKMAYKPISNMVTFELRIKY